MGKFYIVKDTDDQYWYVLMNEKGDLLLRGSEGHPSRIACEMSIPSVRQNASLMVRYVLRGFEGRYSFILKDAYGTVIGVSEVHAREWNRRKYMQVVQRIAPTAALVHLSPQQVRQPAR